MTCPPSMQMPGRYGIAHFLNYLMSLSPGVIILQIFGEPDMLELHVVSDASIEAIGYVAYLKSLNERKVHVSMITASSKVFPRCATTIPRLELCAAVSSSLSAKYLVDVLSLDYYLRRYHHPSPGALCCSFLFSVSKIS